MAILASDHSDHGAVEARRRILIVEDDPDLRGVLFDELVDRGNDVVEAADGAEALERMREHHPDVVVFDLMMPRMDGWQFRLAQRLDPALARTPVVAMSASATASAQAVDADVYLAKPFAAGALVRAIDDVVNASHHRDELERAAHRDRLAALGTLAAGLAHEINNPLTYVMLDLAAAQKQLTTIGVDDDRRDHLTALLRQAEQGVDRIRNVVRSVRILAQAERARPEPLDVRAVAQSALAIVIHDVRERARLVTDFGEAPWVLAEESQLGQVFLNLLLNAIQAIPEGAPESNEIRIKTATDDGGAAVIEISDTGEGIPDHLLPRIFEPFFTTKPVGQGSGLGLSISHGIVASFGGIITVESAEGHGTTVRVALPPRRRVTTTNGD